jgi:malonate transporter and related proteins
MQNFLIILNLVAPVFLIVGLGYVLRKFKLINDNFVTLSSKIVFSVSLPVLIFMEIARISIDEALNIHLIVFIYGGTLISFFLIWVYAAYFIDEPKDRGAFIQGSFRGNFAIIGLALIANIYGADKLGKASLILAFTIPLYNVLSVIALTVTAKKEKELNYKNTLIEILKNPLILGVLFAVPFSYFEIIIPDILLTTGNYIASLTLPLALIGIGGFLRKDDLKKPPNISIISTVIKLIIIPAAAAYAAYVFGFKKDDLGLIFILFACPTAIASFIMAEAMGHNSRLAGNILLLTTLFSVITITIGLFILVELGLI